MWWWYVLRTLWHFLKQCMRCHTAESSNLYFRKMWQFADTECWPALVTWASCSSRRRHSLRSTQLEPLKERWRERERDIYRVREIEIVGTRDQDTKRRGFRQLPSLPPPHTPRRCDHYVLLLQNSKRVSSNGGLRYSPMWTEDNSTWVMRRFWFHFDVLCVIVRWCGHVWQMWNWLRKFILFIVYMF